jgi:hypothetical protein
MFYLQRQKNIPGFANGFLNLKRYCVGKRDERGFYFLKAKKVKGKVLEISSGCGPVRFSSHFGRTNPRGTTQKTRHDYHMAGFSTDGLDG